MAILLETELPPEKIRMEKSLLFLDVDGVLNKGQFNKLSHSMGILPEKMELLNQVLVATDCRVVISSAWRYIMLRGDCNLHGLEYLFRSHGMKTHTIVGVTERDTMIEGRPVPNERGQQIANWLSTTKLQIKRYAVVDDLDLGIRACGHPFVQTDGDEGLTEGAVEALISLLI